MRKQAYIRLTMLGMAVALLMVSAQAQYQARLVANIPFDFTVGDKTMLAGWYTIKPVSDSGLRSKLLIRSEDGRSVTTVDVSPVQAKEIQTEAKLLFNRYGDQYFLSQVWTPGSEYFRELPKSEVEIRIAKSGVERRQVSLKFRK
jgi:hypothetical protein